MILRLGGAAERPHPAERGPNHNVLKGVNFPDPSILYLAGVSYVYGTRDRVGHKWNVPMVSNADFTDANGWSQITDVFPGVDVIAFQSWAVPMSTWAPDVSQLTDGDGSFVMYYSPQIYSSELAIHCLGVARSTTPTGPFNDSSTAPWICPEAEGGAIDAAGFLDSDTSRYVVYKIDGPAIVDGSWCNNTSNPPSYNTSLMLQQVGNDGSTFIEGPAVLYNNQGVNDTYNVEAPSINKGSDGTYFLFFSSGCTTDNSYTLSYVTSTTGIWGPYGDRQVLLQTGSYGEFGPGGADISSDGQMVFHSLAASDDFSEPRILNTAIITLSGQTAAIS